MKIAITVDGKNVKVASQDGFVRILESHEVRCLIEHEGEGDEMKSFEIADFESLEDGHEYELGPKQEKGFIHKHTLSLSPLSLNRC
jgi:hypothetical protein